MLAPLMVLLVLWLAASAFSDTRLALAIGIAQFVVLVRAVRDAGAGVAAALRAIERDEAHEREPTELLDDLRVTSVRTLLQPQPKKTAEALEHHG